jgi:hypothetical protein
MKRLILYERDFRNAEKFRNILEMLDLPLTSVVEEEEHKNNCLNLDIEEASADASGLDY